MSLFEELSAASLEAQGNLVELMNQGSFTISGDATTYQGVFNEHDASDPLTPTAIETIRILVIIADKAQFTAAPSAAPRKTVTAKGVTWTLASITDTPISYRFTCRPLT